jgi:hypothetical protein
MEVQSYTALGLPEDYDERLAFVKAELEDMEPTDVAIWIMYLFTVTRCRESTSMKLV